MEERNMFTLLRPSTMFTYSAASHNNLRTCTIFISIKILDITLKSLKKIRLIVSKGVTKWTWCRVDVGTHDDHMQIKMAKGPEHSSDGKEWEGALAA